MYAPPSCTNCTLCDWPCGYIKWANCYQAAAAIVCWKRVLCSPKVSLVFLLCHWLLAFLLALLLAYRKLLSLCRPSLGTVLMTPSGPLTGCRPSSWKCSIVMLKLARS